MINFILVSEGSEGSEGEGGKGGEGSEGNDEKERNCLFSFLYFLFSFSSYFSYFFLLFLSIYSLLSSFPFPNPLFSSHFKSLLFYNLSQFLPNLLLLDIALYRSVDGFLTQFGISDNPEKKHWHYDQIKDDPLNKPILKHYISFAGGAPKWCRLAAIFLLCFGIFFGPTCLFCIFYVP